MKTIGLIGGMSWESTQVYYKIINKEINKILGGHNSAKVILESVNFAEIEKYQSVNNWEAISGILVDIAKRLESAGAECIILCTNTMHTISHDIIQNTCIPFIHITNSVGEEIIKSGLNRIALLGTKYTMESNFYKDILSKEYDIEVMIPPKPDIEFINDVIFNELVKGIVSKISRTRFIEIIHSLQDKGAQGVILGCTEIPILISSDDIQIKVFDTTTIHAYKAVDFALS